MAKNKKMLLIFPPQWTPIAPHFAMASLMGQLKNKGYNASCLDLNIEFYNNILTTKYLNFICDKIKSDYVELFKSVKKMYSKDKKGSDYSLEEQCDIYKFGKIKELVSKDENFYQTVPTLAEFAVNTIKSQDKFYEPKTLINAMSAIDRALKLVSTAWAPTNITFDSSHNPFLKLNFNSIDHFVFDKKSNLFWDFLKNKVNQIKEENYDFIAISLNSSSQIIAGLTLGFLLKKYTKAHVNIGGNFFGRVKDEILKRPEFSKFCDSISIEEGEGPIVEVAKFVNGQIPIEKVPNLVYFKNNSAFETPKMCPTKQNDMENINLDDYNLSAYFAPKIVMPYQTSRGCYWGKCTFCDQDFGMNFSVKSIDKVVSQMSELKEKYGITHYEFIDESVSPTYLKDLSKSLLKTDINPSFFLDARLETAFSEDIFKDASKAGLKMILWGLESGSKKIMESINKGIDLDKRFEILKNSNKHNIWNFAFIFFGYPLETQEDARMTIDMLCQNHKIINSYGRSVFTMGKHAKLAQEPEKYGITKLYEVQDEFSPSLDFDCIGMTKQELNEILNECRVKCFNYYENPLWMFLRFREWLFLYVDKYGVDWVSNYKVNLKEG